jgi:tripartite ATP-independent transporter DctP family solute receptor
MKTVKKYLPLLVLVLFCISIIAGCGGSQKAAKDTAGEKIVLRMGHQVVTDHTVHKASVYFAEKVKEKTSGKVEVQIFPGGQLGGEKAQIEGMMAGTQDLGFLTNATLANWIPSFMAIDLPYVVKSEADADRILGGEVGKALFDLLPSKNIYGLAWGENGFRHFTNSKRSLTSPDDLKGLKIRSMENKLYIDMFRMLGCDPTPMAFTEVYTGLQQGTVDGQENPTSIIFQNRFYEPQKYLSLTAHAYSPFIIYASKMKLDKLPADIQKAIREAALEAGAYQRKIVREDNAKSIENMEKKGIKVDRLTPEQLKVWADRVIPLKEQYKNVVGADIYNKIMQAAK